MSLTAWQVASALCGVGYFSAWSLSFYPQILLNYRRKSTLGLSPDLIFINPIGFLGMTLWSFGAFFSTVAREQYQERHNGHLPQVSASDLAFALHAFILSSVTFVQSVWYWRRARQLSKKATDEATPLVAAQPLGDLPTSPSIITKIGLAVIGITAAIATVSLLLGRTQLLDFLYYTATVKLVVTTVKYIPQIVLQFQLKSVKGYAIEAIFCDVIGGVLSLLQLVISAVAVDHAPSGIIANPGKLGLSLLTLVFDSIFIVQKYWLYHEPATTTDEIDESL